MQQFIGTARPGITQNVAFTGTAGTITNPISSETYKVRVLVTSDAYITLDGTTPTSSNALYLPALSAEYFTTTPGQKVSAVQVSASGTLYVTECL
jgi:hypothetical protein